MVPAYEGKDPYIFASYAHKDSHLVLPIIELLYDKKYRVWYDEGIAPGSEWPKNIADHLNGASGVIYFVSENSLASPNCENEVGSGCLPDKDIVQYLIGGVRHEKLAKYKTVASADELLSSVDDKYIGDGSGYDRKIHGKKYRGLWNVFLVLAGIMVAVFAILLYGLNTGWFDKYLPGVNKAQQVQKEVTVKPVQKAESVDFGDSALENILASQIGKESLYQPVEFENEEEKYNFQNSVGWDRDEELTYKDLTDMNNDSITFEYATDGMLDLLKYMPNVREIYIQDGKVTDLSSLKDCVSLESVWLDRRLFPLTIPEKAGFKIMILE